jgi:hypothetical protein
MRDERVCSSVERQVVVRLMHWVPGVRVLRVRIITRLEVNGLRHNMIQTWYQSRKAFIVVLSRLQKLQDSRLDLGGVASGQLTRTILLHFLQTTRLRPKTKPLIASSKGSTNVLTSSSVAVLP